MTLWGIMSTRIFSFSDLHIGAPYAIATENKAFEVLDDIKRGLREQIGKDFNGTHYCVLNGDIFEFLLRRYGQDKEEMLDVAGRWLASLVDDPDFQNVRFRFNIGNHEQLKPFYGLLDQFQIRRHNFEWSPEGIVIGKALFTHGDPEYFTQTEEGPKRGEARDDILLLNEPKRLIHSVAQTAGGAISRFYFPLLKTFENVTRLFDGTLKEKGITDIVIGHIHEPNGVMNYPFGDYRFHVTGTGVRSMHNFMITMEQDDAGNVLNVRHVREPKQQKSWIQQAIDGALHVPATMARLAG